jgi:serine/threonine-protein kinase RIO1
LRRFEHEGEMLGRLQHPGIAQIHQSGTYTTEHGVLPYFAMEYVEGERLDHYVSKRGLSIRARLELMALVADAVEHAHQKSVIHRDLKPGNILVTAAGQPKILDFGVARLSDDETRTTTLRTDIGALMGTLPYMSPEQAGGDPQAIDTRSDVYSLGVLLYELLAGKLPYLVDRGALPDAVRVIQQEEPSKLSTHDRALRGDVETIVQKALEKDRERRYPSAQALADDIRRHLSDEPILARPPSAGYQLSKFARRNKALVGAVAAVLLTSLVGAAVSTRLWLRERAASASERTARERAETQQARAEKAAAFLRSLFDGIHPRVAQGADTALLQSILGDARARLAPELAGQPAVEAELRGTLGSAYIELNLFDDAEAELRRAHALELPGLDSHVPRSRASECCSPVRSWSDPALL